MKIGSMELSKELSLVTVGTALIYTATYFIQVGVAIFYGYPLEFISIDMQSVLKTLAIFMFVFSTFFHFASVPDSGVSGFFCKRNIVTFFVLSFILLISLAFRHGNLTSFRRDYIGITIVCATVFFFLLLISVSKSSLVLLNDSAIGLLKAVSVIVTFASIFAGLSGYVIACLQLNVYETSYNDYYFVNSFGSDMVLVKCDGIDKKFIKAEFEKDIIFKKSSTIISDNKFLQCVSK